MITRPVLGCLAGLLLIFSTPMSQATATSTDALEGAIAWAEQQEASHAPDLKGWCQVWVQTAYNAPTPAGADSAWIYFTTLGRPHAGDQPERVPRGALVFFKPSATNSSGHVGIALGNGQMVSVLNAGSKLGVWNTPITYVRGFVGWSKPPSDWPGRPGFGQGSQNPNQTGNQNPGRTGNQPAVPDFGLFVGTWKFYGDWITIQPDGTAVYQGRTHVFCDTDPRPPCDGGDHGLAGLNTTIKLTRVQGNTAYGSIVGGSGDRDVSGNILPVGSTISVSVIAKGVLSISDGLGPLRSCDVYPDSMECVSNT